MAFILAFFIFLFSEWFSGTGTAVICYPKASPGAYGLPSCIEIPAGDRGN